MKTFSLNPQDAWFFRDGRPYNKEESNQADVSSVFPPPARTLSGAFRAALARANGWNGKGAWSEALNSSLGNGPDDLGPLQFSGPFLIKDGQALWPLPRLILGRAGECWLPSAFLCPDKVTLATDAGDLNLPLLALRAGETADGLKPAETSWATASALGAILNGNLPQASEIFPPGALWEHESRVGLHRDEIKLTTGEGALYSPAYVRLKKGVALGVGLEGLAETLSSSIPSLFPLGGESRLAQCDPWPHDPLPVAPPLNSFRPDQNGYLSFAVILLTPGAFREPPIPGVGIVSACLGKPQLIGGWNSVAREPLPLKPHAPAGSVWFCQIRETDFPAIHSLHGSHIGPHASHGFGQIILGHWPINTN